MADFVYGLENIYQVHLYLRLFVDLEKNKITVISASFMYQAFYNLNILLAACSTLKM